MKQKKSIQNYITLFMIVLSCSVYSQYGVIEMKDGKYIEMGGEQLHIEGEYLRYFTEEYVPKHSVFGSYKKEKERMHSKSKLVKINNIHKVHVTGEFISGKTSRLKFEAIRFIKEKKHYEKYYELVDGPCKLLAKIESGNALYSYFVQKGNNTPYKLHKIGTMVGAKFTKKSKKFFADCQPVLDYLKKDKNRTRYIKKELDKSLINLVKIYNENCAQ